MGLTIVGLIIFFGILLWLGFASKAGGIGRFIFNLELICRSIREWLKTRELAISNVASLWIINMVLSSDKTFAINTVIEVAFAWEIRAVLVAGVHSESECVLIVIRDKNVFILSINSKELSFLFHERKFNCCKRTCLSVGSPNFILKAFFISGQVLRSGPEKRKSPALSIIFEVIAAKTNSLRLSSLPVTKYLL